MRLFSIALISSVQLYMATMCNVFATRWDDVLLSIHHVHPDDILESLCKTRIRESGQLKTVLARPETKELKQET